VLNISNWAVCCSVWQCVAVCCSVLQCVTVLSTSSECAHYLDSVPRTEVQVLQCVAVGCSVLRTSRVSHVLQCVAVCCSVLRTLSPCAQYLDSEQSVAVVAHCCSVLSFSTLYLEELEVLCTALHSVAVCCVPRVLSANVTAIA